MAGGITANTPNNILRLHKGYFEVNGTPLGARQDGDVTVTFNVTTDYPNLSGALDRVRETGYIIAASGSMSASLTEMDYAILSYAMSNVGYDDSGASERLGGQQLGAAVVLAQVKFTGFTRSDGKAVEVVMPYADVEIGSLTGGTSAATVDVTFNTLVDVTTPDTFGMYIDIEK